MKAFEVLVLVLFFSQNMLLKFCEVEAMPTKSLNTRSFVEDAGIDLQVGGFYNLLYFSVLKSFS